MVRSLLAQSETVVAHSNPRSGLSPFLTVRLLLVIAHLAETYGWLFFAAICLGCGWGRMKALGSRQLDHDELFTFYIAQAPTLRQLFNLTHTVDLHPPLSYLLVRASFAVFGPSSWSCRLPFLLSFLAAAALLFFFVSRLLSPLYGLISTLFLWSIPMAYLATEARPYAMLLCFTVVLLVSWQEAIEGNGQRRARWAMTMVTLGAFGLLLSHVLGVLAYSAFLGAELLRFYIRRKPDWGLWAALVIPAVSVLTYLPLFRIHSTMLFAQEFRVTPLRLVSFYWESVRYLAIPLTAVAFVTLLWPLWRKQGAALRPTSSLASRASLGFLLVSFSLAPIVTGLLFARTGTAFFDRYAIVWLIPLAVLPSLILAYRTEHNRLVATLTALLLASVFFLNTTGKAWSVEQVSNLLPARAAARLLCTLAMPPIVPVYKTPIPSYLRADLATAPVVQRLDAVAPELPLVANTGLTFLELDRQEDAQVTNRLYLLTDERAASSIVHDTVFSHYERVKQAFPMIRGKIESYSTFISSHPKFVVVGAYDNPQGWLLRKLERDGAELRVIGICGSNTEDCHIYEIHMSGNNANSSQP
jgi:4-amino-4-deoxy-L-arabinose transferase-like glycosyltransferase